MLFLINIKIKNQVWPKFQKNITLKLKTKSLTNIVIITKIIKFTKFIKIMCTTIQICTKTSFDSSVVNKS